MLVPAVSLSARRERMLGRQRRDYVGDIPLRSLLDVVMLGLRGSRSPILRLPPEENPMRLSPSQKWLHRTTLAKIHPGELRRLYLVEGWSTERIADRFDVCRATIRRHLHRHGVSRTPGFRALTVHMPEDQATLGYVAGLFDGEGTIVVQVTPRNRNGSVLVNIVNTYRPVIEWLHQACGGTVKIHELRRTGGLAYSPIYIWRLTRARDALAFLLAVLPYLQVKRQKAEEMVAWLKSRLEGGKPNAPSFAVQN